MKKIITTITIGLAAVALAAPAQAAVASHSAADARGFVASVRREVPVTKYVPAKDIHALGDAVCTALRKRPDVDGLLTALVDSVDGGMTPKQVGFIVGASTSWLCHSEKIHIEEWLADNGY